MIRSMTGFGSATVQEEGLEIQAEIRSVNNRFFDFQPRLPRELGFLEAEILEKTRRSLGRGRVTVTLSLESRGSSSLPELNEEALAHYHEQIRKIRSMGRELAVDHLGASFLQLPGLFLDSDGNQDADRLRSLALRALDESIADILSMKEKEGAALSDDLLSCLDRIEESLQRIRKATPQMKASLAANLRKRLEDLLDDLPVDPQRLAQEAAILVDKADVSEEITRLDSHLEQFRESIHAGGEVSKKLGFLIQEILRESNTIGSKSQDLEITRDVLLIKEETEKLREQILNLE
ncbi:MAG: YicC/YloC family endoribonuclease [Candidatus Krumholzibacteria bacterium]|nr:YicC/YloC family endoribonuclease [Candidatus Krumholzibacteria bacterium]MDP7022385.1 YicC/YloC family endoribonuclease [Candidatus Krumholzibacteria bacterium]